MRRQATLALSSNGTLGAMPRADMHPRSGAVHASRARGPGPRKTLPMFRRLDHWLKDADPDEMVLYHYTSAQSLGRIIDGGALKYSPYSMMNDPREAKEWVAEVIVAAGGVSTDALQEADAAGARVDVLLRRGARLASFTLDRHPRPEAPPAALFHKGWARANMWAAYGGSHTGACLVFDRQLMVEQLDLFPRMSNADVFSYGRVLYADTPISIPLVIAEVRQHGVDAVLDDYQTRRGAVSALYFTKNSDWSAEQEFRIIRVGWDLPETEWETPLFVPIADALRAVVLGDAFEFAEVEDVRRSLTRRWPAATLARCAWDRAAPVLEDAVGN